MVEGRKKGEEGRRGYKRKDLLPYLSLPTTLGWIVGGENDVFTLCFLDWIIGL
jgi:hypothetical protein